MTLKKQRKGQRTPTLEKRDSVQGSRSTRSWATGLTPVAKMMIHRMMRCANGEVLEGGKDAGFKWTKLRPTGVSEENEQVEIWLMSLHCSLAM